VHANGLTLARRALLEQGGLALDTTPRQLQGESVGDVLLEPTVIYVRAVVELLASPIPVHGLAHITGGGVLNLLRIGRGIGYEISSPLLIPPVFGLIAELGEVSAAEMWQVFNMGCGFTVIVPAEHADDAVALLGARHPGTAVIGKVSSEVGTVALPGLGLAGGRAGLRAF
jgi:phosphoribosylformylglycinamidine cyclo-ligase